MHLQVVFLLAVSRWHGAAGVGDETVAAVRPAKDDGTLEMLVLVEDAVDGDLQPLRHLRTVSGWPFKCFVLLLSNGSAACCMHGERRQPLKRVDSGRFDHAPLLTASLRGF